MNVLILTLIGLNLLFGLCHARNSGHTDTTTTMISPEQLRAHDVSPGNPGDEVIFTVSFPRISSLTPQDIIGQKPAKDACQLFFEQVAKNHTQTRLEPKFASLLISGPAGCSKSMLCQAFANQYNCILVKVDVPLSLLAGSRNFRPELLKTGITAFEAVIKNLQWIESCAEAIHKQKKLPVVVLLDNMHLLLSSKGAIFNTPALEAIGTGIAIPVRDALITALEAWKNFKSKFGVIGLFSELSANDFIVPELASKFDFVCATGVLEQKETKELLESLLSKGLLSKDFDYAKATESFERISPKNVCAIISHISKVAEFHNLKVSNETISSFLGRGSSMDPQPEVKLPAGFRLVTLDPAKTLDSVVVPTNLQSELQDLHSLLTYFSSKGEDSSKGITAFVGESGSGKSTIIEAFSNSLGATLIEVDLFSAIAGPSVPEVIAKIKQTKPTTPMVVNIVNTEMLLGLPTGYLVFDSTIRSICESKLKDVFVFVETTSFNGFEQKLFKPNLISKILEVQLPSRAEIFKLIINIKNEQSLKFSEEVSLDRLTRQCIGLTRSQILATLIKAREKAIARESDEISSKDLLYSKTAVLKELNLLKDYVIPDPTKNSQGSYSQHCKHKGNFIIPGDQVTTFDDVAGQNEAKEALKEFIEFLQDPDEFTKYGNRPPKGILFHGPPGTGKTLLARAMAGEAGVPMIYINGASFVEMYVGVGASRIRDLFKTARRFAPCVIFIDEIDAVGSARSRKSLSCGEAEATLNQLLSEMDGFEQNTGIIVIGATNQLALLDKAIRRPGRMDREVKVTNPSKEARMEIMKIYTKSDKLAMAKDVSFDKMAELTTGCSGADIENIVIMAINLARKEAVLSGQSYEKLTIKQSHFERALDLKFMGEEKRDLMQNKQVLNNIAIHESGHAILQASLKYALPFHKVTIVGREGSGGHSRFLAKEDHYLQHGLQGMKDQIAVCMGSRAAEYIILGKRYPGVSGDLDSARQMAYDIVCRYGGDDQGENAFGPTYLDVDGLAEATKYKRDEAIQRILNAEYERAVKILSENKVYLEKVIAKLLDKEELSLSEIKELLQGMEVV